MEKLSDYFELLQQLEPSERGQIENAAVFRSVKKQTLLRSGAQDCIGLLVVKTGVLRAFIVSDEGREITIYRLFPGDVCLFSASCMMRNIEFEILISAEQHTEMWVIPVGLYEQLMERNAIVANYTNDLMASRFSGVMWLMEQVLFKSVDRRLAGFLVREAALTGTGALHITHEKIAGFIGTAREVVTRMLKYFAQEGMVALARGVVTITDEPALRLLAEH